MKSSALAVLYIAVISSVHALHYNNNTYYFDETDFFHAECVPKGAVYFYYGNRSTTAKGNKCENWKNVLNYHHKLFRGYNQFFFPDEFADHNHCRQIFLDDYERVPWMNNASAHSYVQLMEGWREGPWCYVKLTADESKTSLWGGRFLSDYRPDSCFPICEGFGSVRK